MSSSQCAAEAREIPELQPFSDDENVAPNPPAAKAEIQPDIELPEQSKGYLSPEWSNIAEVNTRRS